MGQSPISQMLKYLFLEMFGGKLDSPVYNPAEKHMQDRIGAFKAITDSLPWTAQSGISHGHGYSSGENSQTVDARHDDF